MIGDLHEPKELLDLMKQNPDFSVKNLNKMGYADFIYPATDGIEQVERKTVNDIISKGEEVEAQLVRQLTAHPKNYLWLIVEGIIEPSIGGSTIYKIKETGRKKVKVFYPVRSTRIPFARFEGWLTAVEKAGIGVKRTSSYQGTAQALATLEMASKHQGTALRRHLKPVVPWNPNPQVMTLLGAYKSNIGPETAELLIKTFGTVWNLLNSPVEIITNVPGIGDKTVERLFKSFGKTYDPNI